MKGLVTSSQLNRWLNRNKPVDNVFAKLKLVQAGDNLIGNPQFLTWVKYLDDFNMKHPQQTTSMVPILAAHYNNDALLKLLKAVKKSVDTKGIAIKLEAELVEWSIAAGKFPTTVFKLFGPEKVTEGLLQMPQFVSWLKYENDIKIQHSGNDVAVISVLSSRCDDNALFKMLEAAKKDSSTKELANKLQEQQFRAWLTKKISPDDAFEVLELDKVGKTILSNRHFSTWMMDEVPEHLQQGESTQQCKNDHSASW